MTAQGRLTGVFVMFAGVGIIGALASILASLLVPPPKPDDDGPGSAAAEPASMAASTSIEQEIAGLRAEIEALRLALTADGPAPSG